MTINLVFNDNRHLLHGLQGSQSVEPRLPCQLAERILIWYFMKDRTEQEKGNILIFDSYRSSIPEKPARVLTPMVSPVAVVRPDLFFFTPLAFVELVQLRQDLLP
jgi:hypothetical protein